MLPSVNNIQEAIPVFINALLTDNLLAVNNLLDKFPKLILLKDKRNRNVLMMTVYGRPIAFPKNNDQAPVYVDTAQNHNVISYLVSFYVIANPKIDINHQDDDGLTAYDWAVLGGNDFAVSLLTKLMNSDGND